MRAMILGMMIGLLAACPGISHSQEVSSDTSARFAKSLKQLGSDDFQEREAASAEIAALPSEAIRLVEAELKKGDQELEVRTRLERALPGLRLKLRRKAQARKKEAFQAWTRKTVLEAYDRVGIKDDRWNAKAREALTLAGQIWANVRVDEGSVAPRGFSVCVEAIEAGCNDPLVLFARARLYDIVIKKDFKDALAYHLMAANGMKTRGEQYPPIRQAYAFWRAADYLSRIKQIKDAEREESRGWLDLALVKYTEAARDPDVPDPPLLELGKSMTLTWKTLSGDRNAGIDKVLGALTEARPESSLPLIFKGDVYTTWAWDARGNGYANTVKEEGWKLMGERLAEAETSLTKAWEKDPTNPEAPTLMLVVELGQGKGRPVMETWFKRAMEADPDNHDACNKKMYYLEPKWHGSNEEMIAFGRDLLAGGNFEARLPFGLTDAHVKLAGYLKDATARAEYYANPEVWKDVQGVYEGSLKVHPKSVFDRSWYAKFACWCGQYGVAHEQFEALGDKVVVSVFASRAEMERLKTEAAEKGR